MIIVNIESVNVDSLPLVEKKTATAKIFVPIVSHPVHGSPMQVKLFGLGCWLERFCICAHPSLDNLASRSYDRCKTNVRILSQDLLNAFQCATKNIETLGYKRYIATRSNYFFRFFSINENSLG